MEPPPPWAKGIVILFIEGNIMISGDYNLVPASISACGRIKGVLMRLLPKPFVKLFNLVRGARVGEITSVDEHIPIRDLQLQFRLALVRIKSETLE